ncbi:MAG: cell division ATP-binding protein FtsE [Methylococcales bacterium]
MLKFEHVSKRYEGGGDALLDVSFHLQPGEMAFLTGHSGAGKSTVLKLAAAIEQSSHGQIKLEGQSINKLADSKIPYIRRKMGLIFQDYKLLQDRTVFDNVALPMVVAGYSYQDIAKRVRAALDKVALSGKEQKYPHALSGGEQQRVGIARAVVNKPALILADEPTGNLDPELSTEIMRLFTQFTQLGVTILVATHDIDLINRMEQRVIKLHRGRLVKG